VLGVRSEVANGTASKLHRAIIIVGAALYIAAEFVEIVNAVVDALVTQNVRIFVKNGRIQLTFLPESTFYNLSGRNGGHISKNRDDTNGENGDGLHVLSSRSFLGRLPGNKLMFSSQRDRLHKMYRNSNLRERIACNCPCFN